MLLVLTRGSPLHSLLFPSPPSPSLPLPYYYGVEGALLYPYLEGGIGSGQQVGILGITPLVTHIGYPPPTPLMGATLGGCR